MRLYRMYEFLSLVMSKHLDVVLKCVVEMKFFGYRDLLNAYLDTNRVDLIDCYVRCKQIGVGEMWIRTEPQKLGHL